MVDYAYRGYSIDVEARHNVVFVYVGKKSQTAESCRYDKGINVAEAVEKTIIGILEIKYMRFEFIEHRLVCNSDTVDNMYLFHIVILGQNMRKREADAVGSPNDKNVLHK